MEVSVTKEYKREEKWAIKHGLSRFQELLWLNYIEGKCLNKITAASICHEVSTDSNLAANMTCSLLVSLIYFSIQKARQVEAGVSECIPEWLEMVS